MSERAHLSIGEVLSLLREEFPDVTISKIRFLESQGLLDPERTPSGYRKFYEEDVERLRWILRQQRENFLPLKVIKGRLIDHPDGALVDLEVDGIGAGQAPARATAPSHLSASSPSVPSASGSVSASASGPSGSRPSVSGSPGSASPPPPSVPPATAPSVGSSNPGAYSPGAAPASSMAQGPSGGNYTIDELAAATGLSEQAIDELARFGLLGSRDVGGTVYYDEDAATIAALSAGFARHGVEARHLRMYKNAAERESALFEQIVMPLVKQRNPQARQQAATALEDLGRLSAELRRVLLRQALGNAF